MSPEADSFVEYRKLILSELERLSKGIEALVGKIDALDVSRQRDISALAVEVGMLKVRAGLWGALAGAIPAAIAIIFMLLRR